MQSSLKSTEEKPAHLRKGKDDSKANDSKQKEEARRRFRHGVGRRLGSHRHRILRKSKEKERGQTAI